MKLLIQLCIVTAILMSAASAFHLIYVYVLGHGQSPWESMVSLGISAGVLGLLGLLQTVRRLEGAAST